MSFINPWMLWGLAAAAVPIVIHMIHRRRPRRQAFAAVELLLRSVDRVDRRWRIQRFLLLASRVLLLALLAFAASRPIRPDPTAAAAVAGPKRLAIVVDTSMSMRARQGAKTSFARAVDAAHELVDAMGPEDLAVVVNAGLQSTLETPEPTADRRALRQALRGLEVEYGRSDLGRAVTVGVRALDPGPESETPVRIAVLSDLTDAALQTPADTSLQNGQSAAIDLVEFLTAGETDPQNTALTSVLPQAAPGSQAGALRFLARLRSYADEEGPERIVGLDLLSGDDTLETTSVDLPSGAIADQVVEHVFDMPGVRLLTFQLSPDRLDADDRFYVSARIRPRVRVLVVDGDPSGVAKEDEVFYVAKALETGLPEHPPARVVTADELADVDLSGFEVVVLAGVDAPDPVQGVRLVRFVEAGGGLLISTSATIDAEAYNQNLSSVLPRALRGLKRSGSVGSSEVVSFAEPDLDHPIFELFQGDAAGGLLSTTTRGVLLLQPTGRASIEVPLRYGDGQPAMVVHGVGSGRVALFTSSIDRDLTDFPIRPAFLPWVRRTVLWLSHALEETDGRTTLVGEARVLRAPPDAPALQIVSPSGESTIVEVVDERATFSGTDEPGHYRVLLAGSAGLPLPDEHFAVNVDPAESDLRPLDREEANLLLSGQAGASDGPSLVSALTEGSGLSAEVLAGLLLAAALLFFVTESLMTTQRISRG